MTVGRGFAAFMSYKSADRKGQRDMVTDAICDEQAIIGYLRELHMRDFDNLQVLRVMKYTKSPAGKFQRKADYYNVLARMAKRREKIRLP